MKTGVSLFTGGGLCDTGLSSLVSWVAGIEYDSAIAAHTTQSLGHPVHCADVREVDYRQWAGVDYLHMSPPCTNASVANAKAGETEIDLALGAACIRAIEEIRPGYVTLENVWQYRNFEAFRNILNHLSGQGYRVHFASYDAADFGVPQHRNRLMLRAWKENRPLPEVLPMHGSPREVARSRAQGSLFSGDLLPWIGWYEAVADLLPSCPDTALAPWQINRLTAEYGELWLESLLVNGVPANHAGEIDAREGERDAPPLTASIEKHPMRAVLIGAQGYKGEVQNTHGVEPAPTPNTTSGAGAYRAILIEGDSCGDRPPTTLPPPDPVGTLRCSGGGRVHRVATGHRIVALTTRCLARFQSIPDSYPLPIKKSLATKIIGNGVACRAAEAIFGSILR